MSELKGEAKKTFNAEANNKPRELTAFEKFQIQREAQQAVRSRTSTSSFAWSNGLRHR